MIVFESHKVRHVVARLDRGEDLHEALEALAKERHISAAWVAGIGVFESCELTGYDPGSRVYQPARQVDSPVDIVNLTGNISFEDGAPSVHLHATVSRLSDHNAQLLGGRLVRARAFACEVRLDVYDDIALGREHDPGTGLSLWAGESTKPHIDVPASAGDDPRGRDTVGPPTMESPPPSMPGLAKDGGGEVPAATAGGISWADVADASADSPKAAPAPAPAPAAPAAPPFAETLPEAAAVPAPRLSLAERRRMAKVRQVERKESERQQRARSSSDRPTLGGGARAPLPGRKRKTEAEFLDEVVPEVGDYVDHQAFGLCRVEGESQSGGLIIRLETGGRKAIMLSYLEVSPPRIDDRARKVFVLKSRRRS